MRLVGSISGPWLVLGNFNTISSHEKLGGRALFEAQMKDFNGCIRRCQLNE